MWLTTVMASGILGLGTASAQGGAGALHGTVVDPLGARLEADVTLLRDGQPVEEGRTNATGEFAFDGLEAGRYEVEARADGFAAAMSKAVFVGASSRVRVEIALPIGSLRQFVVVTAAATELPEARVGSPVSVIDSGLLRELGKSDVLEAMRTIPGIQVLQTGQRGGTTNVFVRGGAANFNKVLIDGVPANDIGGAFNFGVLSAAGVDSVEVLRTANSVLHGSDALSGVINLTTPRGRSTQPELTYSIDGGNLGTVRHDLAVGGVVDRFDYFVDVSRFDTDNDLPNNAFQNNTFAGRFGVALGRATDLSLTVRRIDTSLGLPGAVLFNGLINDQSQDADLMVVGVTARSQLNDRWGTTFRFSSSDQSSHFIDPSPTGEPFDPASAPTFSAVL